MISLFGDELRFTNITDEQQLFGMPGTSDGYLEYIFIHVAKELFGMSIQKIEYKQSRSSDMQITILEVI